MCSQLKPWVSIFLLVHRAQKMIKREVCAVRVQQLEDEIAGKMKELQEEIQRLLPPAMEAHQRAMEEWKLAHDEWASSRPRGAGGPGDAAYPTSDKDGSGVDAMARVGSDGRHMSLTPMGSDADTPSAPAAAGGSGLADKGRESIRRAGSTVCYSQSRYLLTCAKSSMPSSVPNLL